MGNDFHDEELNLKKIEDRLNKIIDSYKLNASIYKPKVERSYMVDYQDTENFHSNECRFDENLTKAKEYTKFKPCPYFCRLDIIDCTDPNKCEYLEKIFIGEDYIYDGEDSLVYSWKSEMGTLCYKKSELIFSIEKHRYKIKLRRSVTIENEKLISCKTEYDEKTQISKDKATDPYLISILNQRRKTKKLLNIITTIQENQYDIITCDKNLNFVVQGCAGSGKTMILLHRLSYLIGNKKISPMNIMVITPSNNFDMHIDGLSKKLGLNKVNRVTVEEFYQYILVKYQSIDKINKTKLNNRNYKSEQNLNASVLKEIYRSEISNNIAMSYTTFWQRQLKLLEFNLSEFSVPAVKLELSNMSFNYNSLIKIRNFIQNIKDQVASNKKLKEFSKQQLVNNEKEIELIMHQIEAQEENIKIAKNNILIKFNSRQLELQKKLNDAYTNKLKLENQIEFMDNSIKNIKVDTNKQKNNTFGDKRIISINKKLEETKVALLESNKHISELITENITLTHYCEVILQDNWSNLKNITEKNTAKMINTYLSPYKSILHKLNNLKNRKEKISKAMLENKNTIECCNQSFLTQIDLEDIKKVEYIIESLTYNSIYKKLIEPAVNEIFTKNCTKVPQGLYRYKLYLKLILCSLYYGSLNIGKDMICIDEAQDISVSEYKLLNNILKKNCAINLYGDVNQTIFDYKGLKNWNQIKDIQYIKQFNLNENYRNTCEITDYCNEEFIYNIHPIGIEGSDVLEYDLNSALQLFMESHKKDKSSRLAIIVNKINHSLKKKISSVICDKDISWETVNDKKISVITIESAKGIEFDEVIVIKDKLTKNQQYVAFTRALEKLIVVTK